MAGNSFGEIFKVTTFGESHGPAIGCVIDGVPPGLELETADIQADLDRRRPGQSTVTTQRSENDAVEILSGTFAGLTTGTPIALLIRNTDQRSHDYSEIKDVFRPGHADYTFFKKFGLRDHRGGGRSSGRETAARVAAGAIAKKLVDRTGIKITAYTLAIGDIKVSSIDLAVIEENIVRAPDLVAAEQMISAINLARNEGDSLGGIIEIRIEGCPAGLGDPVFDKLEACLAHAMLSIGAVKGVEFGAGFAVAGRKGSTNNDEIINLDNQMATRHNYAGGISGGIANGEPIVLRIAVKPTSSIAIKQSTLDLAMNQTDIEIKGRHDPCLCPRIVPVAEAMAALVIADRLLLQETLFRKQP
ncbi:MAG: chorismate synthase [Candidatus Omnitrophica bacterium]|nr:chorismate synthase [Candidatus Omnitrophota bacterium]